MPPPAEGLATKLFIGPAMRTQSDGRLVALVREGYELAFEEIVRRYRKPLARFAASIVGPHSEDVTQDAFSKALLALRRDGSEIDLRPWLYRIVRNTALNNLRDNPVAAEELAENMAGGRTAAEVAEQKERLADLIRQLNALPDAQRAAIVMRELEGLGHAEIAAALGLSGGAARQAIHRARSTLREGLGALLPLPLLRAVLDHSGTNVEAAAGAAGIGAGAAIKATAATVLVAGAVGAGIAIDSHSGHGALGAAGPEAALAKPAARNGSGSGAAGATGPRAPGARRAGRSADGHRGRGRSARARGVATPAEDAQGLGSSRDHGGRQAPATAGEGGGLDGRREGGDSRQGGSGSGGGTSGEGGDDGGLDLHGDSTSGEGGGGDGSVVDGGSSGDGSGSDGGGTESDGSGSDHEGEALESEHEGSSDGGSGSIEETSTQATGTFDGSRDSRINDGLSP